MYRITQQFLYLNGRGHISCVLTSLFLTNNMLLWWAIDSVPLPIPLVIKPKIAQW